MGNPETAPADRNGGPPRYGCPCLSKNRVDERRQRLDGRRENQDESEQAHEDGQRHEPAFTGVAPPQSAREVRDGRTRAPDHDQTTPDTASSCEHAISCSSGIGRDAARFVTMAEPATSRSSPHRRNVEYPSSARFTI